MLVRGHTHTSGEFALLRWLILFALAGALALLWASAAQGLGAGWWLS